jgi:small subunit ribosomal protein S19e
MNIYDCFPEDVIENLAAKLKDPKNNPGVEAISPPKESIYWKTSQTKEMPPIDSENFWYIRAASIMRKLYRGPIGVNRLKKQYGGRHKNTTHREHVFPGSGAIIRRILQQLEKAQLVKKADKDGRELTNAGRSMLDKTAAEILKQERGATTN